MDPLKRKFKIPGEQIKRLVPSLGSCIASDRITVDGMKIGYMYREEPDRQSDSGWRFFAGDEDQKYSDNPDNFSIYEVNTVCNYDQAIIPYLDAEFGSAFVRSEGSDAFSPEVLEPPED